QLLARIGGRGELARIAGGRVGAGLRQRHAARRYHVGHARVGEAGVAGVDVEAGAVGLVGREGARGVADARAGSAAVVVPVLPGQLHPAVEVVVELELQLT